MIGPESAVTDRVVSLDDRGNRRDVAESVEC